MRIIHTADWHIGNTFYGFDRSAEHRHFLDFLLGAIGEYQADALVVAGDVFDNPNPSAEAQAIYYDFLGRALAANPGLQIVVIAGNHDSAARLEAPQPILEGRGVYVRGSLHHDDKDNPLTGELMVELRSRTDADDMVVCLAVPFLRAADLPREDTFSKSMGKFFSSLTKEARSRYGKRQRLMLAAHFYATGSEIAADDHSERVIIGGEENVDASKFCEGLSYAALGHIHKAQRVSGMDYVRYSGSALPMSFGERGYRHGVNVVDFNADGTVGLTPVEYHPLRALVSIPRSGAATAAAVEEAAGDFAKAGKRPQADDWPYVEVVLSEAPDSATAHSIKESFAGREALLCVIRNKAAHGAGMKEVEAQTEEQLRQLDPATLVRSLYKAHYDGEEMPQALMDKFNAAVRIARENEERE